MPLNALTCSIDWNFEPSLKLSDAKPNLSVKMSLGGETRQEIVNYSAVHLSDFIICRQNSGSESFLKYCSSNLVFIMISNWKIKMFINRALCSGSITTEQWECCKAMKDSISEATFQLSEDYKNARQGIQGENRL